MLGVVSQTQWSDDTEISVALSHVSVTIKHIRILNCIFFIKPLTLENLYTPHIQISFHNFCSFVNSLSSTPFPSPLSPDALFGGKFITQNFFILLEPFPNYCLARDKGHYSQEGFWRPPLHEMKILTLLRILSLLMLTCYSCLWLPKMGHYHSRILCIQIFFSYLSWTVNSPN